MIIQVCFCYLKDRTKTLKFFVLLMQSLKLNFWKSTPICINELLRKTVIQRINAQATFFSLNHLFPVLYFYTFHKQEGVSFFEVFNVVSM